MATIGVYVLAPVYGASSTVVVEPSKVPSLRTEAYPAQVDPMEVLNTEMAIVLSRTVVQNVVDRLKLPDRLGRRSALSSVTHGLRVALQTVGLLDAVAPRERWIENLQRDVKVRPIANSNAFTIRYSDADPRLAADLVNAVTDEYLQHHFGIYSEKRVADFYRTQMALAQERLRAGRQALERFKTERALAAVPAQKTQLAEEIRSVRERASKLRLDLTELAARFGEGDQRVGVVRAKIRASEAEIGHLAQQLQTLETAEAQAAEMEVVVKAHERSYLAYQDQFDRASISAAGDKNVVNVRVVDYASVPARPAYSRLFLIGVATGVGLLLGLVAAMVREYFDHRVVTPALAEKLLGVPVLGFIEPQESGWMGPDHRPPDGPGPRRARA
jgi:uncharacterized protein involved in exopolysaccharide biosynthesis